MKPNMPTGETMSEGSAFSAGGGLPPELSGAPAAVAVTTTQVLPVSALAMPDEAEQMEPPKVGDVVNFQVEGKVTAVDGNNATVTLASVNGQAIGEAEDDKAESGNEAESLEGLQKQAGEMGSLI
jgi:hypothetical protein